MTMNLTMILCILGSTFLFIMPDNTTASDKFFQTGGRFGKRHEENIPDIRYAAMVKTRSVDNVPPRIERGFYISRYGKRSSNSITDPNYFTLCLPPYGIYCDFIGLPNLFHCKRVRPAACSNLNYVDDKTQMKPENDVIV